MRHLFEGKFFGQDSEKLGISYPVHLTREHIAAGQQSKYSQWWKTLLLHGQGICLRNGMDRERQLPFEAYNTGISAILSGIQRLEAQLSLSSEALQSKLICPCTQN